MPTLKLDIWDGSFYRQGISTNRLDRARRFGKVTGLTPYTGTIVGQDVALQEASQFVLDQVGEFHHLDETLPLATLEVRRWGPTKAWCVLDYNRRGGGGLSSPAPQLIARYRASKRTVRWYSAPNVYDDGLPSGPLMFHNNPWPDTVVGPPPPPQSNPFATPTHWEWSQPIQAFYVPCVLNFNPDNVVMDRLYKVNQFSLTFGNKSYEPFSLRFDGLDTDHFTTPQGDRWSILYHFTYARGGWIRQFIFPPGADIPGQGITPNWAVRNALEYESASFANFPYT